LEGQPNFVDGGEIHNLHDPDEDILREAERTLMARMMERLLEEKQALVKTSSPLALSDLTRSGPDLCTLQRKSSL
jgi:hypothetical protein